MLEQPPKNFAFTESCTQLLLWLAFAVAAGGAGGESKSGEKSAQRPRSKPCFDRIGERPQMVAVPFVKRWKNGS